VVVPLVDTDPADLRVGTPLRITFQRPTPQHEAVPVFSVTS
jgi:hypothetical protein